MLNSGLSGSSLTNVTPVSFGRRSSNSGAALSARLHALSSTAKAVTIAERRKEMVGSGFNGFTSILWRDARYGMALHELIEERLTHSAIGAFFDVYNTLGFGFLETVYAMALERELIGRGHRVSREVWIPVLYKGEELCKQRLDMIVDEKLSWRIEPSSATTKANDFGVARGESSAHRAIRPFPFNPCHPF